MASEQRWANAVRVLALVCASLAVTAVMEGVTIRRARAEVQALRTEHDRIRTGVISAWTREPAAEAIDMIRGLNAFYADPTTGFGRVGGLCSDGHLDEQPIVTYVLDTYLKARSEGRSPAVAHEAMNSAILQSDDYHRVHPDLALSKAN